MIVVFLSGLFIGSSMTYAWLRWECERAVERLGQAMKDEIDRS